MQSYDVEDLQPLGPRVQRLRLTNDGGVNYERVGERPSRYFDEIWVRMRYTLSQPRY